MMIKKIYDIDIYLGENLKVKKRWFPSIKFHKYNNPDVWFYTVSIVIWSGSKYLELRYKVDKHGN